MSKLPKTISILIIGLIFAVLPSINMNSTMNGIQSGKSIVFLWGIGIISFLSIVRFWYSLGSTKFKLSSIDLMLLMFVLYILFQNNIVELILSLLFFELIGLTILYFIIRQQNQHSYLWLMLALIAGGMIQSIYGNLQLWGYFPSHHRIFKMTGSFFNPGPYSGYLATIFPISLGFYLFSMSVIVPIPQPLIFKPKLRDRDF